ncbi:MAG: hypothetical protein AAF738_10645, partial [Bacteroidota bacterium]
GLLCGFCLTFLVLLLEQDLSSKRMRHLFRTVVVAAAAFLIAVFGATGMFMISTEGYPLPKPEEKIFVPRIVASLSFLIGILSIGLIIAQIGWVKSKNLGWFSTIVAIITVILILLLMS